MFEYDISFYPSKAFKKLAIFCSEKAECSLNEIPADQKSVLIELLNDRGLKGWELIQLSFGKDGIISFWKRLLSDK